MGYSEESQQDSGGGKRSTILEDSAGGMRSTDLKIFGVQRIFDKISGAGYLQRILQIRGAANVQRNFKVGRRGQQIVKLRGSGFVSGVISRSGGEKHFESSTTFGRMAFSGEAKHESEGRVGCVILGHEISVSSADEQLRAHREKRGRNKMRRKYSATEVKCGGNKMRRG